MSDSIIVRIDDYLLQVDIIGTNEDGTLAVEYNVMHKNPDMKIDHEFINEKLGELINKILEEYIANHDA